MAEIVTGDLPNADQLPEVNLPESPIQESDDRGLVITISPPREDDDISAGYLSARKDMNAMSHPAWQGAMDAGIDPGDTVADKPMFDRVETRTDGESKYHVGVNDDDPSTNVVLMVEDFVGDVAAGIGKGAVSGLQEAGEQIGDTLTGGFWSESIAPWLRENIPYLPEANVTTQEMLKPEGTVQEVTATIASPLAQVVAPGSLLSRTFRAAGIGNRYLSEALGYGVADVAAVDPKDTTLLELGIQLIDDSSEIREMLETSLGAQEDENAFIERLKNAPRRFLEGGPVGLVFERAIEGLGMAYRAIKNSPKYRGAIDVFNETAKAAQQGTFFSGIPTRPDVPASVGQIDEANRVIADDLVNRPELWGEDALDINERREMVDAMLRGERFEGDEWVAQLFNDHAERLSIEQAEPAPVFYSAVANAVDALPMDKGNASQMRAMIAKSAEVKPEEMAWIGLDDFLAGKKSVSKQEIKEFVDANQVRVEEVVKSDDASIFEFAKGSTADEIQLVVNNDEQLYQSANVINPLIEKLRNAPSERYDDVATELGDALVDAGIDPTMAQKMVFDDFEFNVQHGIRNQKGETKFSDYTLPGGENYREVLLRLPDTEIPSYTPDDVIPIRAGEDMYATDPERFWYFKTPDNVFQILKSEHPTELSAQQYILKTKQPSMGKYLSQNFTGGHYDESNVLAHMRLNDRTGPDGEKILFVEEIQSDWHQKGRKQGYRDEKAVNEFEQYSRELAEKYNLNPNHNLAMHRTLSGMDDAEVAKYEELQQRVYQSTGNAGVPDAPLKKTWHEMSFRRIARMAAEEGYDAIAWTPGKLQAERYDLSKQISRIELRSTSGGVGKASENVGDATMLVANDINGNRVLQEMINDPEDLAEHIGKEAADKLLNADGVHTDIAGMGSFVRSLEGNNLSIGGEGMKGFYDKMLKGYAAKCGKKFGAKVGVTDLVSTQRVQGEAINTGVAPNDMTDGQLLDELGYSETAEVKTKVWTLPVTKKMRDSVLGKGVATFGAAGVAAGLNNQEAQLNGN